MAIAGGITVAYKVRLVDGVVGYERTNSMREHCHIVDDAIEVLQRGETALLAGGDMAEFNRRIDQYLEPSRVEEALPDPLNEAGYSTIRRQKIRTLANGLLCARIDSADAAKVLLEWLK